MGRHAAKKIIRARREKPYEKFRYRDKGSLATIGKASRVADLERIKVSGFIGWILWLAVHIFFLIGFRNRFVVMFEWAWDLEPGSRVRNGMEMATYFGRIAGGQTSSGR